MRLKVTVAALAGTLVAVFGIPLLRGTHTATPTKAAVAADLARLPLAFERNVGQADSTTEFLTRQPGYDFLVGPRGSRMVLGHGRPSVLSFRTLGSSAQATVSGNLQLPGRVNYFQGRSKWHTDIATYGRVDVQHVYPGVDLAYTGNHGRIEYTFSVAANADPGAIRLGVDGASALRLDAAGNLVAATRAGNVVEHAPIAYQTIGGKRRLVHAAFTLHGSTVAFALSHYDRSAPVVIDPVLTYSTYLGGDNGNGQVYGVALTNGGDIVVTGSTSSPTFPSADSSSYSAGLDNFVMELDPTGSSVVYSTYVGGDARDQATGIALDSAGDAYITGYTDSNDYPLQASAPSTNDRNDKFGLNLDAFVTELNPSGDSLVYSTLVGGTANDESEAIAVGSDGAAYITGLTGSTTNFPTTAGAYEQSTGGPWAAFVTKLEPAGADPERIEWSTFLGGHTASNIGFGTATAELGLSEGLAIAVDSGGNAYVGGITLATDFPTTSGAYSTSMGTAGSSGFVSKVASGGTLAWSTYLGSGTVGRRSQVTGLALSGSTVVVAGSTNASDFPTTAHGVQLISGGGYSDAFVAELKPTAKGAAQLAYSTYLGGDNRDAAEAVATDAKGDVYVTGQTSSGDFPTAHAFSTGGGEGIENAFVTELQPSKAGSAGLTWSTYLGGGGDAGLAIAADTSGDVFVAGETASQTFPTVNPLATAPSSFSDTGFLAEIAGNASSHILALDHTSGSAGDTIVITGAGLTGATAVKFGGVADSTFVIDSDTQITAHVPELAVDGNVTVTSPSGTSNGVPFDVVPVIDSFSPTDGAPGQLVTVDGRSLVKPTALTLDGAKVPFKTVTNSSRLTFVVPATATDGAIAIKTADGVADTSLLVPSTFTVDSSVATFTPLKAAAGATVTITGHGLGSTTGVDFTGAPGQVTSVSATSVKVVVPDAATTGSLTIHTGSGDLTTTAQFTPLPRITGYDQASYQETDAVTIDGTGLDGATFKLGTATLTGTGDAIHFTTSVPTGAVTAKVTATTTAGKATGPLLLVRPKITSLSASDGVAGTVLTLGGTTFTGTKSVMFAGAAGPAKVPAKFTVSSATQLKVTVPATAVTGAIAVKNAGGETDTASFEIDPAITSFSPSSGSAGTTVTVHGSGFATGEQASVGGVDAGTVTVTSPTAMTLVVPPGVTSGDIDVWTDPTHKAQSSSPFTVTFSATQLEQTVAPAGARITIDGTGLTGVTSVHFDDAGTPIAVAPSSIASDGSSLTVIVPSTGTADGVVGVYKSATSHTTVPGTFTRLTVDAPHTIAAPGDTLTLTGDGFTGAWVEFLNGWTADGFVTPSSVNGAGTVLTVTVPGGFTGGEVQVVPASGADYLAEQPLMGLSTWSGHVGDSVTVNANGGLNLADSVTVDTVAATVTGGTSSSLDFTITSADNTGYVVVGGTSSVANFDVEPEITQVSPASGPAGRAVDLLGDHLTGIANATVDGTDVTSTISFNSATDVKLRIPGGATGGQITVTNPSGSANASYTVTLSITGFSPGDATVGTPGIVITGIGFTSATGVTFNGTAASFTVDSDTQITATVPSGASTGPLTVTAPAGTTTSASAFTVDP